MKVLTVSDEVKDFFFQGKILKEKCRGIDLILACGDLPPYYLEYLVNSLNVPLYYVPGNHDDKYFQSPLAQGLSVKGCKNIDQRVMVFKNLLIGGLAGSFGYRKGKYLYTEAQMHRNVLRMYPHLLFNKIRHKRYIDILVTHAPPFGINDEKDMAHRGFKEFLIFMKRFYPGYLIHGHTSRHGGEGEKISSYHSTCVINTNPYRVLEIDDANLRRHHN